MKGTMVMHNDEELDIMEAVRTMISEKIEDI
jgi:hypothetical protein